MQHIVVVAVMVSNIHLLIRLGRGTPVGDIAGRLGCEFIDKILLWKPLAYLLHTRLWVEVFFGARDAI